MSNTMTKRKFHDNFMSLLSEELGIKSYFNSSKLIEIGIKPITDNSLGECHSWKDDTPVVIKYRKGKEREMLGTLIHEYAHAILHKKNKELSQPIREIEAETVAQNVLRHFSITDVTVDYIDEQKSKCSKIELEEYKNMNREIISILEIKKNMIKNLSNEPDKPRLRISQYKYGIMCPCCNNIIASYKRMSRIISKNGKGYYCMDCGKDETLDKLIVMHY